MDGEKKQAGRPQAYTRESQRYIQELELRRRRQQEQKTQEATNSREQPVKERPRGLGHAEKETTGSVRRRQRENAQKLRVLFVVLGVLIVLLVAAIIYEVVLGYGVRQTGSERMAQQTVDVGMDADTVNTADVENAADTADAGNTADTENTVDE